MLKFRAQILVYRLGVGLVVFASLLSSCATLKEFFAPDSPSSAGSIPTRSYSAMTGSQFIARTKSYTSKQREAAIAREILAGNIPSFLRRPVRVDVSRSVRKYGWISAAVWVMPDYLAIGSDSDFVRMPMTPMTAQRIADEFGYILPTRKLVNDIHRQASIKLSPSPMNSGRLMSSNQYYEAHNRQIERQLGSNAHGRLVAGHKKDIVITNQLIRRPTRVAIYGWHRRNGVPIQPLSLVHGEDYADYSHGVRLVRRLMKVNGHNVRTKDVLAHKDLAALLSDEGAIVRSRLQTYLVSGLFRNDRLSDQ